MSPSVIIALAFALGARPDPLAPPAQADGLAVATPAEVGLRADIVAAVVAGAGADRDRDLRSLLVARHGRLVVEAYFFGTGRETLQDVRSVGKSLTSTLVGIAIEEGQITGVDRPYLDFFPGHRHAAAAGHQAIKLRDLLEMRSGLAADDMVPASPGNEDRLAPAEDWLRFALAVPTATRPGERFVYASLNSMLLGRVVAAATGGSLERYARAKIFAPLGITRYEWRRDPDGHVIGQGGISLRSRDLLKLGLLYANRGHWAGRQLVPAAWIDEATRPRLTLPVDATTRPIGFGDYYTGYGYQWWTGSAALGDRSVAYFVASGNGGQKLFVVPSLDLVVVVTSGAYQTARGHRRSHGLFRQLLNAVPLTPSRAEAPPRAGK